MGINLTSTLSAVGVLTSDGYAGLENRIGFERGKLPLPQTPALSAALRELDADLLALGSKSGVTVADLNDLTLDSRAIAASGFRPDPAALQSAIAELASAVASGADVSEAQTTFNAVFDGSDVPKEVIDRTFDNLVRTIKNSNITPADLETIAADRAAIRRELASLPSQAPADPSRAGDAALLATLAQLGVVPGPDLNFKAPEIGEATRSTASAQLIADIQKLKADLQALAAKSRVTVADLNNLKSTGQAIAATGFRPDVTRLQAAIGQLASAVAAGGDLSRAEAEFNAVFSGSTVSQDVIEKALSDLVQTILDSNVTPTDLATIAADRAAIKTDLEKAGLSDATPPAKALPFPRRPGRFGRRGRS